MPYATTTISAGDPAPIFALLDQNESSVILKDQAGKPTLIFLYAYDEIPGCHKIALAFRDLMPTFEKLNIQVFGVSLDAPLSRLEFARKNNIYFPLLCDYEQKVSRDYGVISEINGDTSHLSYERTAVLLDINLRVVKIYKLSNFPEAINAILEDIQTLFPTEEPRHITTQAPVLLIPRVLDVELCQRLIHIWETEGNEESGSMRRDGNRTIGVLNYNHKIRRDHFLKEGEMKALLDRIIRRRVFPEIKKAFHFDATRREDYRIGCYDSRRGGFFRAHRDNTTGGTAHRRFAMTLNLNANEYEGGYLKFPEFGPHFYKPETGSAVIFSCSLMHEATDVIAGRRFVLLSFFYGEKEAQERQIYESRVDNNYNSVLQLIH